MPRYPTRPSPREPFITAAERLFGAIASAEARQASQPSAAPAKLNEKDAALMEAVQNGDIAAITAAIKNGADANAGGGRPLRLAGESRNDGAIEELVLCGAEISTAVAGLKEERKSLAPHALNRNDPSVRGAIEDLISILPGNSMRRFGDREISMLLDEIERQRRNGPLTGAGAKRVKQIDATIQALEDWQTRFLRSVSPIDILRQQRRILDELAALKREISPQVLDKPKPKLPAPKP